MADFVNLSEQNQGIYGNVLGDIENAYDVTNKSVLARVYLNEAAWSGPSFVRLARRVDKFLEALKTKNDTLIMNAKINFTAEVENSFKEYKKEIDRDIFVKMMEMYYNNVPKEQIPPIIPEMVKKHRGDFEKWGDHVYGKSIFVDKEKMVKFLERPSVSGIEKDPAYVIQKSILDNYFNEIMPQQRMAQKSLEIAERLYVDGLRKMYPNNTFYPNANFTMRLTYGTVGA